MPKPARAFAFGCVAGSALTILLVLGGILVTVYGFKSYWIQRMADNLKAPPITTGLTADYAWTVTAPDGTPHDLEQLKGKAVFLNFWDPACPNCMAEMGALNTLYIALQGSAVQMLGVVTQDGPSLPDVIENEGIHFPVYSFKGTLPAVFQTASRPATFIIAPDGNIVFKHLGAAKWDDPAVLSFLALLAQAPPAP